MSSETLPSTPMQQRLSRHWRELLGIEVIKQGDHFLELGGNSMLATLLANRLEDELGIHPTIADVFNTLEQLAVLCEEMVEEQGSPAAPAGAPAL
ncbi:MAG: hypothetical protein JXB05_08305 [Myxococcaceae bacterium]|nr:hypothetical protein [Myxococcaceae bacterium]